MTMALAPMTEPAASRRSAAFEFYATAGGRNFMTIAESEDLSADLSRVVRESNFMPDVVVGIANGALLVMDVIAREMDTPREIVFVRRKGSRIKQRLLAVKEKLRVPSSLVMWGPFVPVWRWFQNRTGQLEPQAERYPFDVAGKQVLLVDDCIVTGGSLAHVKDRLLQSGAASVKVAVLCWCDTPEPAKVTPDWFLHRQIQFYPWSNNSPHFRAFVQWIQQRGMDLWR